MTQLQNSREPILKSEGTFYERKGYYLQWRLDHFVDEGKLTDNEAEEMAERLSDMISSPDREMSDLGLKIMYGKLRELRSS